MVFINNKKIKKIPTLDIFIFETFMDIEFQKKKKKMFFLRIIEKPGQKQKTKKKSKRNLLPCLNNIM